jgi:phenylalanyl-tRNA synthetase beta chain
MMRVSYKWLSQYIELQGVSAEELADKITRAGVEVDAVLKRNQGVEQVVVGYVQDRIQHPNADKLSVCQVDLGEEAPVQIVCGAANVDKGQKVAVAKVGAVLPGNFKIKKAKLRGEVSEGMICSAQELGIEDRLVAPEFKEGIMVLPEDAEIGSSALDLLDLDDEILELDLTPNRSDCLSMLGVAYEVGAILGRGIKRPAIHLSETEDMTTDHVRVEVEDPELCPLYVARRVKNIKIGPSPLWLQNRLIAGGIRPINNVVDVTNYVMLELGQPLHAFDARLVKDGHIIVRAAREGERVVTLDDQERELEKGMLLITDPEKTIAIAGVMGAANSEVASDTTEVILESAYFNASSVRTTSRALGLRSEASARFEKGIDPEMVYSAIDRAAALIAEIGGGEVNAGYAEFKAREFNRATISLNMARLNRLLGTTLTNEEVEEIIDRLDFEYENKGHEIFVEVPLRRQDLTLEEDMIEEVARLYGYDRIPTTLPSGETTPGSRTVKQKIRLNIRKYLQGAGLQQVITYSLTKPEFAAWSSYDKRQVIPIQLQMPMSEDRSTLRTTLIPQLLEVASYNRNRKIMDTHIFDIGHVFLSEENVLTELPQEEERISGLLTGKWHDHPWQQDSTQTDFFVAKGVVEGLFRKLEVGPIRFERAEIDHYHPGRTAHILLKDQIIGLVGQIHPQTQSQFDLDDVYVFELSLDRILEALPGTLTYQPLPKYPGIQRDLAIIVDRHVAVGEVQQTIKEAGSPLVQSVALFDVYTGDRVDAGKKSLAYSLQYLDPNKTLTDEEVKTVHERVIEQLKLQWGATLRQ